MKLFAGLNKAYDHSIFLCLVDSSGIVVSRTQWPPGEQAHLALCSLLTAFNAAYRSHLLITLTQRDRWEDPFISALQSLHCIRTAFLTTAHPVGHSLRA